MGPRKFRWTEERLEEWFHDRLGQWLGERLGEEFGKGFDERLDAWADSHFQDRVEALFASRLDARVQTQFKALFGAGFDARARAWKDDELKDWFDDWVRNWFDDLFTVWANTWADSPGFREKFATNFAAQFHEHLDVVVKARVANEINTHIDRRIEAWLLAVREELLAAAALTDSAAAGNDGGTPDNGDRPFADRTATAAELATYLAKGSLQPQQIRKILKGKEIPGQRPTAYPLGEAAATLLSRRRRQERRPEADHAEPPDSTE
ncbi:hypothetical protein AB0C27_53650 [Nonomuraea sp. NPDC048882]|uniref:hypothetical protein n=1 Tax=Nonomuraea sp. NPDC048882 TaxID=3154347 RepID=UPI0033C66DBA